MGVNILFADYLWDQANYMLFYSNCVLKHLFGKNKSIAEQNFLLIPKNKQASKTKQNKTTPVIIVNSYYS